MASWRSNLWLLSAICKVGKRSVQLLHEGVYRSRRDVTDEVESDVDVAHLLGQAVRQVGSLAQNSGGLLKALEMLSGSLTEHPEHLAMEIAQQLGGRTESHAGCEVPVQAVPSP